MIGASVDVSRKGIYLCLFKLLEESPTKISKSSEKNSPNEVHELSYLAYHKYCPYKGNKSKASGLNLFPIKYSTSTKTP